MSPVAPPSPPMRRRRTWTSEATERAARALAAGGVYFLAIASASAAFGPLRTILIVRGAPDPWATILDAALPLVVLAVVPVVAIRLFRVRDRVGDRLMIGSVAVTLMMVAELGGESLVRGWGLYETLTGLMPEPSSLFVACLVAAVLTPLLEPLGRTGRGSLHGR